MNGPAKGADPRSRGRESFDRQDWNERSHPCRWRTENDRWQWKTSSASRPPRIS